MIEDEAADDDAHHGLLMLQHLFVDPDASVREAANDQLLRLAMNSNERIASRVAAILSLEPVEDDNLFYPRGKPAGLGQPGVMMNMEYFGHEPDTDVFYQAQVNSDGETITVNFRTKPDRFGDPSESVSLSIVQSESKNQIEISGDISTGNLQGVRKKDISAKVSGESDLEENHPDEFAAYQRVVAAIERGYKPVAVQDEANVEKYLRELEGRIRSPDKN